jgi:hypothetical protein
MFGNSRVALKLAASQERLSSMELVSSSSINITNNPHFTLSDFLNVPSISDSDVMEVI